MAFVNMELIFFVNFSETDIVPYQLLDHGNDDSNVYGSKGVDFDYDFDYDSDTDYDTDSDFEHTHSQQRERLGLTCGCPEKPSERRSDPPSMR